MAALYQLRNLLRPSLSLRTGVFRESGIGLSLFLHEPRRSFSAEAEKAQDAAVDKFIETSSSGAVYGKLSGLIRYTLKSDVINLLDGCKLNLEDIRVSYTRSFAPIGMLVQFPSGHAIDQAFKLISKKGRLHKLEKVDRSQWDLSANYDGKTILLQGLPRQALPEDVERFLHGCQYDATSIQVSYRAAFPEPLKVATVGFPSRAQAMNAFITKNGSFCLNNQILVRVLQ
ncbi:hypothetical protein SAY86_030401 [Trapa natans]|uniref:Uncharacterized protein n=1 Tax=Trapa natans TaxID=22666 RepID=A0AAN7M2T7_TRANT|nr:hypothetical protein SAY86_030401 [Trapa natans]